MSKLIFTAEMFLSPGHDEPVYEIAQAIHDKYMASGTVVYSTVSVETKNYWLEDLRPNNIQTHTAILHDIKEIEKAKPKCEHKNVAPYLGTAGNPNRMGGYCVQCNKEVKPTGWKLAEGDGE